MEFPYLNHDLNTVLTLKSKQDVTSLKKQFITLY